MKKRACTDKQLTPAATQSSSSKDPNNDSLEEGEANEKNNIRKTYLSNSKGLTLYKFRRLLSENDLHEVLVHGNGYCFLSCIIIALAKHGIKKTLEVLSTEVMSHIRENKDDFYSSFGSVSKSENESETLSKYDCNEYNSTVNLFLHYYPGSKQGKHLDAHYNCYVNTQYYKQNAAAISSMMVKTIEEEEEAEKALKKTNKGKGKTAATSSTNVQSIMEPQEEEAKKMSQKKKVMLLVQR